MRVILHALLRTAWLLEQLTVEANSGALTHALAHDMLPLYRHVGIVADKPTVFMATVLGTSAVKLEPALADSDCDIATLLRRVYKTVKLLDSIDLEAFEKKHFNTLKSFKVRSELSSKPPTRCMMTVGDYYRWRFIPDFFFHATAVYMIARHYGMPLTKGEYLYG